MTTRDLLPDFWFAWRPVRDESNRLTWMRWTMIYRKPWTGNEWHYQRPMPFALKRIRDRRRWWQFPFYSPT